MKHIDPGTSLMKKKKDDIYHKLAILTTQEHDPSTNTAPMQECGR